MDFQLEFRNFGSQILDLGLPNSGSSAPTVDPQLPDPGLSVLEADLQLQSRNFGSQILDLGLPNPGSSAPTAPRSWIVGSRGRFLQNYCVFTLKTASDLGALAGALGRSAANWLRGHK